MKIRDKLEESEAQDKNLMLSDTFNRLFIKGRINPVIDVNISSCYVKLCLGGLRAPTVMVNDHYKIPKVSLVYLKEWNEILAQVKSEIDSFIGTTKDMRSFKAMKIIVIYNEALLNQSLGEYGKAYEGFKHIINVNKYYTDAYLRLACQLMMINNKKKSLNYWK